MGESSIMTNDARNVEEANQLNGTEMLLKRFLGGLLLLLSVLFLQACGPSQEELRIGAIDHFNRGNSYLNGMLYKRAIREYQTAIALDPEQEAFYYNMGLAFYNLILYQQAIDAFNKAIEIRPKFSEAWYNLSLALDKIDETEKAFMAYEKYLKLSRDLQPTKQDSTNSAAENKKQQVIVDQPKKKTKNLKEIARERLKGKKPNTK